MSKPATKPKPKRGTRISKPRTTTTDGMVKYQLLTLKKCLARVMLDRGEKWDAVQLATSLSKDTIAKVKADSYDLPAAVLQKLRSVEDQKLTLIRHMCLDEFIENSDSILGQANAVQLATTFGIFTDKQRLLNDQPTDILGIRSMDDDEIAKRLADREAELETRLTNKIQRRVELGDAELEDIEVEPDEDDEEKT